MRSLVVFAILLFVLFCVCSVVLTGSPFAWLSRIDCILGSGAFGSCLSCAIARRLPDMVVCLGCGQEFEFDDSMDEDLLVQFVCDDCAYDTDRTQGTDDYIGEY